MYLFTARSPVYSHLSLSLLGLHTIRAYQVQPTLVHEFHRHQDLHTEAWFLFLATSRWFAVWLDWLCALFVASVAFCSVAAAEGWHHVATYVIKKCYNKRQSNQIILSPYFVICIVYLLNLFKPVTIILTFC
jgi:hypothetical protein